MYILTCPHCASRLNAPAEAAGKVAPCPNCKNRIMVPLAFSIAAETATKTTRQTPKRGGYFGLVISFSAGVASALGVMAVMPRGISPPKPLLAAVFADPDTEAFKFAVEAFTSEARTVCRSYGDTNLGVINGKLTSLADVLTRVPDTKPSFAAIRNRCHKANARLGQAAELLRLKLQTAMHIEKYSDKRQEAVNAAFAEAQVVAEEVRLDLDAIDAAVKTFR